MINTRELVGAALCVPQHYIFPRGRKSQKKPQLLESEDMFDCLARILEVLSGARALVTRDLGRRALV
jgi:hypothetical protein